MGWEFHLKDLGPYPQGKFHLKDLRPYPQGFETLSKDLRLYPQEISISLEDWLNMEIYELSSYTVLYLFSDYYITLIQIFWHQKHNFSF